MDFEIYVDALDVVTAAEELYGEEVAAAWRWRLKADDGETLANGAIAYESEAACREAIDIVKATGAQANVRVVGG